jgi:hypothetical protein
MKSLHGKCFKNGPLLTTYSLTIEKNSVHYREHILEFIPICSPLSLPRSTSLIPPEENEEVCAFSAFSAFLAFSVVSSTLVPVV